ncbi:hypothetical protein [Planococcus lenghuensis]|nr:hypothetical protein [Planococcus lenghuensis]
MPTTLNATDVRKNWGQFNDDVIRIGPRFVKRSRDEWAALSAEQLRVAFASFQFQAHFIQEDDGSITMTLNGFDLVENAETKEEVIDLMADSLVDYAEDYMEHFTLYAHSPNRKQHFPFLMNVMAQPDSEAVKSLIHA